MRAQLIYLMCIACIICNVHQTKIFAIQHPIVIMVLAHNNQDCYERTLDSIIAQLYDNYRVIYVDDGSTDNSYYYAKAYSIERHISSRCTFRRSACHQGPLAHIYREVQKCKEDEIIVVLDGCDWFADEHVLDTINKYFCNNDVWLAYGGYTSYPELKTDILSKDKNSQLELCISYAWIFKELKLEDLLYNHIFYQGDWNSIIANPLKQLASNRYMSISDILYVSNSNHHHIAQKTLRQQSNIRPINYKPLACRKQIQSSDDTASLLIFSNNPSHLQALLTKVKGHLCYCSHIYIAYSCDAQTDPLYKSMTEQLPELIFSRYEKTEFKATLMHHLHQIESNYILLSDDIATPIAPIDLHVCIRALKNSGLDIFYLPLGAAICAYGLSLSQDLACIDTDHQIYAWASSNKSGAWIIPAIQMTLFSKHYLLSLLENASLSSPDELAIFLHRTIVRENKLGLLFDLSKVISRN